MFHPIHRRLLAEHLVRRRRADEQQRFAASQRFGRIDPNPHQIDAVAFALRRIPDGGCILADEVGLGKTIEAGLVIAQLLAEGLRRALLIVPKSLLGQWQTELYELFGIEAREGRLDPEAFAGNGVFLVHREFAGAEKGSSLLRTSDPFDLIVIDEAHEVFAALHRRFDKDGKYDEKSPEARTAGRVRALVRQGRTPVLLLTATPIQNSLSELWGLVQYVEPSGTLLGKLPTFKKVFCDGDDRKLVASQGEELRRRVASVLQRTLRRQAQEFLDVPFVDRQARLFEYAMSPEEKALYDDVTAWLLQPNLFAFRGAQRTLLLIGFHRLMASSIRALSASLENVAKRLRRDIAGGGLDADADSESALEFAGDLEEDPDDMAGEGFVGDDRVLPSAPTRIRAELQRVDEFARRARSLPADSKAARLIDAVRVVLDLARTRGGDGKIIVFTESLTTQNYIHELLIDSGLVAEAEITLFRGKNDGQRARDALARWDEEIGQAIPEPKRPSRDVRMRLALVHEFRERSRVFISTESGAKGLNLQFCSTLINYDLPWNPQRIEQRIGRIHRYGQKNSVTVINFLARGNDAQRLTLEILTEKLELFGKVLDASDAVLHLPSHGVADQGMWSVGVEFETELRRIYEQARSLNDVTERLQLLRASLSARRDEFEAEQLRAASIIETRLDTTLRQVFTRYQTELPAGLVQLDQDIDRLVAGYLTASKIPFARTAMPQRVLFQIGASPNLPEDYRAGVEVAVGHVKDLRDSEPLHLGHAIIHAAVQEARQASAGRFAVRLIADGGTLPKILVPLTSRRGRLVVTKVSYRGIESVEHLLETALLEGSDEPLDRTTTSALLSLHPVDLATFDPALSVDAARLAEALEDAVHADQLETTAVDNVRFERMLEQLERYVEDQVLVLRSEEDAVQARIMKVARKTAPSLTHSRYNDAELETANTELFRIRKRLDELEAREDSDYQSWRDNIHQRRYQRPSVEPILEVDFVIDSEGVGSC